MPGPNWRSTGPGAPARNTRIRVGSGSGPAVRSITQMQLREKSEKKSAPSNSAGRVLLGGVNASPEIEELPVGQDSSGKTLLPWL